MRLFVSGLPAGVESNELLSRLACIGRIRTLDFPSTRRLGNDLVQRGFVYVEFGDVDAAASGKLVNALNGSVWKGCRLRVEQARPSYKQRLRAEADADLHERHERAATSEPLPDSNPGNPGPMRMRLRSGRVLLVHPGVGTGTRRRFFPPTPALPIDELLRRVHSEGAGAQHSALYHVNELWDEATAKRLAAEPPAATDFEGAQRDSYHQNKSDHVSKAAVRPGVEQLTGRALGSVPVDNDESDDDGAPGTAVWFGSDSETERELPSTGAFDSDSDSEGAMCDGHAQATDSTALVPRYAARSTSAKQPGLERASQQGSKQTDPTRRRALASDAAVSTALDGDNMPLDVLWCGADLLNPGPSDEDVDASPPASDGELTAERRAHSSSAQRDELRLVGRHAAPALSTKGRTAAQSADRQADVPITLAKRSLGVQKLATPTRDTRAHSDNRGIGNDDGETAGGAKDSSSGGTNRDRLSGSPGSDSEAQAAARRTLMALQAPAPRGEHEGAWERLMQLAAGAVTDPGQEEAAVLRSEDAPASPSVTDAAGSARALHYEADGASSTSDRASERSGGVDDDIGGRAPDGAAPLSEKDREHVPGHRKRARPDRDDAHDDDDEDGADDSVLLQQLADLEQELKNERAAAKPKKPRKARQIVAGTNGAPAAGAGAGRGGADEAPLDDEAPSGHGRLASLLKGAAAPEAYALSAPAHVDPTTAALFQDMPFKQREAKAPTARQGHSKRAPAAEAAQTPTATSTLPQESDARARASEYARALEPVLHNASSARDGSTFFRTEPLDVLQAKLKAERAALVADYKKKQRTVTKRDKSVKQRSRKAA